MYNLIILTETAYTYIKRRCRMDKGGEFIMIKAGIIGATGYAGNELARLLLGHKETEVVWYGSRSYIDKEYAGIYQNFF